MSDFGRREHQVAVLMRTVSLRSASQSCFAWSVGFRYAKGWPIEDSIAIATEETRRTDGTFEPKYPAALLELTA
jgi:hypothetical protein